MSDIRKTFRQAFKRKAEKGWNCIYILVDLHGTILKPCYESPETYSYYPWAIETLQKMSKRKDIKIILWSCSYPEDLKEHINRFGRQDVYFSDIGQNRFELNTGFQCFDQKPYFNVGLDDKFGFNPEEDWEEIYKLLGEYEED